MNYETLWKTLCKMLDSTDLYGSENGDLQYLLGYIDGMNAVMHEEADNDA